MTQYHTSEAATIGQPDKLCDIIADSILDECLSHDPLAHVACNVMATKGHIIAAGEVSSLYEPQIPAIVRNVLSNVGYSPESFEVHCHIHRQSPDIADGIDCPLEYRRSGDASGLGAGDQCIAVGYACSETPQMLPLPAVLADNLTRELTEARITGAIPSLLSDGKAQVTVEYDDGGKPLRLDTVVLSAQHNPNIHYDELYWELTDKVLSPALQSFPPDEDTRILINTAGRFVIGGTDADTGLTGRNTVSYCVPHGKDPTKPDRSGAYMARYIAKNLLASKLCKRCLVTLAYAIGVSQPVMVNVDTLGTGAACADDCLTEAVKQIFPLSVSGMIRELGLLRVKYSDTALFGHFGISSYPWERTDRASLLRDAVL